MNKHRKYNASIKGIARNLRHDHRYQLNDSIWLAKKCSHGLSRCEICGIPTFFLRNQKIFISGQARNNNRLTVDHLVPSGSSTLENTRILCHGCNSIRGAAVFSDQEVLRKMRKWYRNNYNLRFLYWLNTSPGIGGRLFRNKYMEQRTMKLLGQKGVEELRSLNIKIDNNAIGLHCS